MKRFKFQGYSDDTFGECCQTNDDYDNCGDGTPIQYELKTPDGAGVIVTGIYGNEMSRGEGWMIGVNIIDENKPVDSWSFELLPSWGEYCNKLIVDAPDDTELRCLNKNELEEDGEEVSYFSGVWVALPNSESEVKKVNVKKLPNGKVHLTGEYLDGKPYEFEVSTWLLTEFYKPEGVIDE